MATTVARLQAVLSANTRDFDRGLDKSQTKMHRAGRAAGVMGAAIFAGLAVVGKRGFDELNSQQEVTARTEAVLKSMGKTAGVTAKDVEDLANSLSRKTGIDDEEIQASENLLLTFRNVRNEVGEGNDMFTQATETVSDFSVVFGKTLPQSAVLVGKALNDPIKGLTSLQRVGVQFTAAQRTQIKALVDSGQTMKAQKIIMAELTAETEGAAEAQGNTLAGQLAKAKNAFDDVAATLVTMLLPAMLAFAEITRKTAEFLSKHPKLAKAVTVALVALATALLAARAAQILMNLAVLANPYVAATVAIVAMSAALFILWQRSKTARTIMEILALLLGGALLVAILEAYRHFDSLKSIIGGTADAAVRVKNRLLELPAAAVSKALDVIHTAVRALNAGVHALVRGLESVVDAFKWIIHNVKKIGGVFGAITGAVSGVASHLPHGDAIRAAGEPGGAGTTKSSAAAGRQWGVGRQLWDEIAIGQKFGLVVTSGFRPGARTRHGTLSDHARHAAVDMHGSAAGMAATFRALIGRSEVKQAFYDPLGSIFNGALSSYREGGHSDHIHIAEYDRGGYLQPGWNLAYNGLGRPEPVGGGNVTIPISIGGEHIATVVFDMLRRKAKVFETRNGRPAFGGA